MNDALIVAKALTEVLGEKIEDNFTNLLSDIGQFDAESRRRLEEFTQQVKAKAELSKKQSGNFDSNTITVVGTETIDPQELLDELRHEIARLKSDLTKYRKK